MDVYDGEEPINIGVGCDWSIREIAEMIRDIVGYTGELKFDLSKPDGMPAKLLDSSCLARLGWKPRTSIRTALMLTYALFADALHNRQQRDEEQVSAETLTRALLQTDGKFQSAHDRALAILKMLP